MARLRPRGGFTLVELMLATIIFSMVVAGLAAIYTTAFSQSGTVLRDSRLKGTAMVAVKQMSTSLYSATRLDQPPKNGFGTVMAGCTNMAPDGVQNTAAVGVSSFAYCVQPAGVGGCGTASTPAPCLFAYTFGFCPAPVITTGNCGTVVSGVTPEMIGARVMTPSDPTMPSYFVRTTAKAAGNQVHIGMGFRRDATGKIPVMTYEVDTLINGQFDARL